MYDYKATIVTLGRWSVGKTSISRQFAQHKYDEHQIATVGVMHLRKMIEVEGSKVQVEIWDTAGQEQYDALTDQYYRKAEGAVVVYDITDIDSFEKAKTWIDKLKEEPKRRPFVVALVGNKTDKSSERQVPTRMAASFAQSAGALFFETSAKTGTNIPELFNELVRNIPLSDNLAKQAPAVTLEEYDQQVKEPSNTGCAC